MTVPDHSALDAAGVASSAALAAYEQSVADALTTAQAQHDAVQAQLAAEIAKDATDDATIVSDQSTIHTLQQQVTELQAQLAAPVPLWGPISVAAASDIPNASIPANAQIVPWTWARSSGMTLDAALATLTANQILELPEDPQPYLLNMPAGGFPSTSKQYLELSRPAGLGIIGLGPGAVVQPSASTYTAGRQTSGVPQQKQIGAVNPGSYFANFTMFGRDFGGIAYYALYFYPQAVGWAVERMRFAGAHRGFQNGGSGETGAVVTNGAPGSIRLTEIDCRDPLTGARVGSSPYMFNRCANPVIDQVYAHHAVAGMPTFFQVNGGTITNLRSEYNGSGPFTLNGQTVGLNGTGHNFEQCTGTFQMTNPSLIVNYQNNTTPETDTTAGGNTGMHIGIGSAAASIKLRIVNPTNDAGPYAGVLSVLNSATYGGAPDVQQAADVTNEDALGNPLPVKFSPK